MTQNEYLSAMYGDQAVDSTGAKIENLNKRREDKIASLGTQNQGANLSEGYSVLSNGMIESNKNKIWNQFTADDIQTALGTAAAKYQLGRDPNTGKLYYLHNGKEYTGSAEYAYMYGTKDNDKSVKFGLARGDLPSSDYRYLPGQATAEGYHIGKNGYGWDPGRKGVDLNKKYMELLLPTNVATALEGMIHGRKEALDNRKYKNTLNDKALSDVGSGTSEYYTSTEGLFGDTSKTKNTGTTGLLEKYSKLPQAQSPYDLRNAALKEALDEQYNTFGNEVQQTISGAASGIVTGGIKLVDALGEVATLPAQALYNKLTGKNVDIGIMSDDFKQKLIEKSQDILGYDASTDQRSLDRVQRHFENTGVDVMKPSTWNKILSKEGYEAAKEFLSNPSLVASQFTEIMGSGSALGVASKVGAKVGVKFASKLGPELAEKVTGTVGNALTSNVTKLAKDAETISANTALTAAEKTAQLKELQATYTMTKKIADVAKGTVYTNADLATRMVDSIDTYRSNNNGEDPSASKIASMMVLNRLGSSAELGSIKSIFKVGGDVTKTAENAIVRGVWHTAKDMGLDIGKETAQEIGDSLIETINGKYGTAEYRGKSLAEVVSLSSAEILTGAMGGAAGGLYMSGANTVGERVKNRFAPSTEQQRQNTVNKYADILSHDPDYASTKQVMQDDIDTKSKRSVTLLDIRNQIKDSKTFSDMHDILNNNITNLSSPLIDKFQSHLANIYKANDEALPENKLSDEDVRNTVSETDFNKIKTDMIASLNQSVNAEDTTVKNLKDVIQATDANIAKNNPKPVQTNTFDNIIDITSNTTKDVTLDSYKQNLISEIEKNNGTDLLSTAGTTATHNLISKINDATSLDSLYDLKHDINDSLFKNQELQSLQSIIKSTPALADRSLPSRLLGSVLSLAGFNNDVHTVKNNLNKKLSSISTDTLMKLNNQESLNKISSGFKTVSGATPIDASYINSVINEELAKRGEVFKFAKIGGVKDATFNDVTSTLFGDINNDINTLVDKQDTMDDTTYDAELNKIYAKFEDALSNLSTSELNKLSANNFKGVLNTEALEKLGAVLEPKGFTSPFKLAESMQENKDQPRSYVNNSKFKEVLTKVLTNIKTNANILNGDLELQKKFLTSVLRSDAASSISDVKVAEEILEKRKDQIDPATYEKIKQKLNTIRINSKSIIEQQAIEYNKKINEIKESIKKTPGISAEAKENIDNMTDEQLVQLHNYTVINEETLKELAALGLDLNKENLVMKEEEIVLC